MAAGHRLELRHTQKLVLTPALQQSLKILQLPVLELKEKIEEELEQNPLLEIKEKEDEKIEEDSHSEMDDWAEYLNREDINPEREKKQAVSYENIIRTKYTLEEHLLWQLRMSDVSQEEFELGERIIGEINDDGYLGSDPAELAAANKVEEKNINALLELIQTFEPSGVGAKNLQDCLRIQLKNAGQENTLAWRIVNYCWNAFEKGKTDEIVKTLNVSPEEAKEAVAVLGKLEPKPGREVAEEDVKYIVPDVFVEKDSQGKYYVLINDRDIPRLHISRTYMQYMERNGSKKEEKKFLEEKFKAAMWLIKSIQQRKKTLYSVTKSIIDRQSDFLEKGIEALKPLTLREIASELNIHESTVSRVTARKYVQTPKGTLPFRYFFDVSLKNDQGAEFTSKGVKDMIRTIIDEEDKKAPLSDNHIAAALTAKGVKLSRRTVAKYREEMKLLSAHERKTK